MALAKNDKRSHTAQAKDGDSQATRTRPLVEIGTELDAELRRFEDLAATAQRAPLNSHKNIGRAAAMIGQAVDSQGRFTGHLQALAGAMASARDRFEVAALAINARAEEIQQRSDEHDALVQRLEALGQEALEIGALARTIGARKPLEESAGAAPPAAERTPQQNRDVLEEVRAVLTRMGALAQQADELAKATVAAGLVDLARQTDSLRQTLGSARQKVTLLERNLLANGPPLA